MFGCILGVSGTVPTVSIRRVLGRMYAMGVRYCACVAHIHSVSGGDRGILLSGQNGG